MSDPDDPERYGPIVKPPHWCELCHGHTGPDSPCCDGASEQDDEEFTASKYGGTADVIYAMSDEIRSLRAILSRLRDDTLAARFKTVEEYRAWVLGVETP